jgi:hypothetical protein
MKFLFPVPPDSIVTQTFAEHVAAARAHGWTNYNGGIDWAVFTGTPVKAAQAGKVTATRHDATGYGTHVRIQHDNGYLTIYCHLANFSVNVGDQVQAGQVIGLSDNTGNSTGPHLHFELRHNNIAIDPMPLLVTSLIPEVTPEPTGPTEPIEPTGPVEPIQPTEPEAPEPQSFPQLPKVRISAVALNVRLGPGVDNPLVGLVPQGIEVEVLDSIKDGDDIWLHIGYQQYIAKRFAGDTYAVWIAD